MNNYKVFSAEEFISMLEGEWRFVNSSKKFTPIKKIFIIPTCEDYKGDRDFPFLEEMIEELKRPTFYADYSFLIVGSCCPIPEEIVEQLNMLVPYLNIIHPSECYGENAISLEKALLEEKAMIIAERLRYFKLMQKLDWF